ncbi:hypothetical protein [Lysobacter sp. 22409]|uniref:hypothetical protein n=1 Tax=Lysobacter sp. 22409 TaxID=3453917 RepID=UPI003F8359D1
MDQQLSHIPFRLFQINSVPLLQRAYAICTAFRDPRGDLKSEYFVLMQTSAAGGRVFGTQISYSDQTDGQSPFVIDETFALDDALHQAEAMYSAQALELDPTFMEKQAWTRLNFAEIAQHRLIGIWAHTPLSPSLLSIADKSGCEPLCRFIYSLRVFPKFTQTQLLPF